MESKVYKTNNLSLFKGVVGNRPIDYAHVRELARLIKLNGWADNVIIVNRNMGIIDGQHRIEALREIQAKTGENFTVQYIVSDSDDPSPTDHNVGRKNWSTSDYVHMHAENGNVSYKFLDQLYKQFVPPYSKTSIEDSIKESGGFGTHTRNALRCGEFTLTAEQYTEVKEFLTWGMTVLAKIKANASTRQVLKVLRKTFSDPDINNEQMARQINKYGHLLEQTTKEYQTELMIEKIYNYNRKQNTCSIAGKYKRRAADDEPVSVK